MPPLNAATNNNSSDQFAFDPEMSKMDVLGLLKYPPFAQIDESKFPKGRRSITEILQNDSRIRQFASGDVIVRQGEYANSAFIVLRGRVRIVLQQLELNNEDAPEEKTLGIWQRLVACARNGMQGRGLAGRARSLENQANASMGLRGEKEVRRQLYLKDIDAISDSGSMVLEAGSLFGEIAAMTRSTNDYTVIAQDSCTVLEVRWQGLRQLRRDKAFRQALDDRYRETSLRTWLAQHELLKYCPAEVIAKIAGKAVLQSYGEREWYVQYNQDRSARSSEQIAAEPLICSEGEHANGLIIVRSGFARKSYQYGDSQRTCTYLSQSQLFGIEELCHNSHIALDHALPYQYSLRALGYLDVIRIERDTFVNDVLPYCRKESLPQRIEKPRLDRFGSLTPEHYYQPIENTQEDALLEFMVENRLVNAREAMVINTDRCTRCDDCVRACATGHGGVSRFNRKGLSFGGFQFTESCMHCVDPVCMIGCPTGAIRRDSHSGVVSINEQTCIGCKTCAEACPYNNIVMEIVDLRNGLLPVLESQSLPQVASKCDMCQRLPGGPACVAACPHEALERVDLSDTDKIRKWLHRQ